MRRRWLVLFRLLGAAAFAAAGYGAGSFLFPEIRASVQLPEIILNRLLVAGSFALFAFVVGYVVTPYFYRPLAAAQLELQQIPPVQIVGATVGLGIGLLLSVLTAYPLSLLPDPFGKVLPFLVAVFFGYLGAAIVGGHPQIYLGFIKHALGRRGSEGAGYSADCVLLDTSVIIDGRIADVAETGFILGRLVVPRFVLDELQQVADSSDTMRRNRGRRGLEVLNRVQQSNVVTVEISDEDPLDAEDVDKKLVRLAERLGCPIMTNDYNLKRVAEIQGIRVLNLNELANAIKTLLIPGEPLEIELIQEGKETDQGVGYLEDGTMVVVEHGRQLLGQRAWVTVTRVLQTAAGRMIFAAPAADGL